MQIMLDPSSSKTVDIEGKEYTLNHFNHKLDVFRHQESRQYRQLSELSKAEFKRQQKLDNLSPQTSLQATELKSKHMTKVHLFGEGACQQLINAFHNKPKAGLLSDKNWCSNIFSLVFNQTVDNLLLSYYESEYIPIEYNIYEHSSDNEKSISFKWHRDSGPKNHLKIFCYLNNPKEHGCVTQLLTPETTTALNEIGYGVKSFHSRTSDIEPLGQHFNIPIEKIKYVPECGDAVIFNPNALLHKGENAIEGRSRFTLQITVVPSPIHWSEAIQQYRFPCFSLSAGFPNLYRLITNQREENSPAGANASTAPLELNVYQEITSKHYLQHVLFIIFSDATYSESMAEDIFRQDPTFSTIKDINSLIENLANFFTSNINKGDRSPLLLDKHSKLKTYIDLVNRNVRSCEILGKPLPAVRQWPCINNKKNTQPSYLDFSTYPQHRLIEKNTPIGNAGDSCTWKIIEQLQAENYNHLTIEDTQAPFNPLDLTLTTPRTSPLVSTRSGTITLASSYLEMAEQAFNVKPITPIVLERPSGGFIDPFREDIWYNTREEMSNDYIKHCHANQQVLTKSKLFIISLSETVAWKLINEDRYLAGNLDLTMDHLVTPHKFDYGHIVETLTSFLKTVRQYNPEFKLIICISPIPAYQSRLYYPDNPLIESDFLTKSTLRVATEQLIEKVKGVYYFPLYEFVKGNYSSPWEVDLLEFTDEVSTDIYKLFTHMFLK